MPSKDEIETSVAMEKITRDVLDIVQAIGPISRPQLEMVANTIAHAYLRGVNDGMSIAMQAMDEALGLDIPPQVH